MNKFALVLALVSLPACQNSVVRKVGGSMTVNIPCGQKLVTASWKQDDLWYLTRPMPLSEDPSLLTYQEKSLWGALEGQVIFAESRCKE